MNVPRIAKISLLVVCIPLAGCAQVGDLTEESQAKAARERSGEWDGNTDPTGMRPRTPIGGGSGPDAPGGRASDAFR